MIEATQGREGLIKHSPSWWGVKATRFIKLPGYISIVRKQKVMDACCSVPFLHYIVQDRDKGIVLIMFSTDVLE